MKPIASACALIMLTTGCQLGPDTDRRAGRDAETRLIFMSPAFTDGGSLPERFTSIGDDHSPPLQWRALPGETKELAIVLTEHTPISERTFWVIYAIPVELSELPEAIPIDRVVTIAGPAGPIQVFQALNDLGSIGYRGPSNTGDSNTTTYTFRVHALDRHLGLDPGIRAGEALVRINSATVAFATLTANNEKTESKLHP
ncbi:MAG TPA: YbhB/YbcL family Raf kinase inhibitor-like protein [Phycisphaerales bacterium]|nr:YbhB/YbcL family Raf kinase inhibitor-like protein [Phycisphaerales bacterium]